MRARHGKSTRERNDAKDAGRARKEKEQDRRPGQYDEGKGEWRRMGGWWCKGEKEKGRQEVDKGTGGTRA